MITIIDSGVANLKSVTAALARLTSDVVVSADPDVIRKADHVILPGVGAAQPAMQQLANKSLTQLIPTLTQPVMGICLGMQLLFERSSENGDIPCLGVIPGRVELIPASPEQPVPHMGWNQIDILMPDHALLRGVEQNSFVYFVHSYAVPAGEVSLATTGYGMQFTAIAGHKNFFGCQFHPERSSHVGELILKNFLSM